MRSLPWIEWLNSSRLGTACIVPGAHDFDYLMSLNARHTIIRRVRLRDDLRHKLSIVGPDDMQAEWLLIAQVKPNEVLESFDLVFLRSDGAAFPWMGFETLKIAKDQAHSLFGVEYVEWEPCSVAITNADRSISWERVLSRIVVAGSSR
jgi:hypothetical protein